MYSVQDPAKIGLSNPLLAAEPTMPMQPNSSSWPIMPSTPADCAAAMAAVQSGAAMSTTTRSISMP